MLFVKAGSGVSFYFMAVRANAGRGGGARLPGGVKICAHCGRSIEPRRMSSWNWEHLRYCSANCRRRAGARIHRDIEKAITALLNERAPSSSICPSEAARRLFSDDFRGRMEDVRRAARRMAARGEVVITQKGRPVEPAGFRGAIRIARGPMFLKG